MQFTFFFGLKLVGEGLREDSNTGYPHGKNQVMPLNYKALGNCGYEIVVIELKRAYPK